MNLSNFFRNARGYETIFDAKTKQKYFAYMVKITKDLTTISPVQITLNCKTKLDV